MNQKIAVTTEVLVSLFTALTKANLGAQSQDCTQDLQKKTPQLQRLCNCSSTYDAVCVVEKRGIDKG